VGATEENILKRVAVLIDLLVAFENLIRLMIFGENFLRDKKIERSISLNGPAMRTCDEPT